MHVSGAGCTRMLGWRLDEVGVYYKVIDMMG